ncbi:MAG: patatin-like phospholipase family protein, partial [Bacteroidota bacterium]
MSEQTSYGRSEREPCTFDEVFSAECDEILERRMFLGGEKVGPDDRAHARWKASRNLTGLALSGGGIRSATFCLGLLQGLREKGLIQAFDYLSTVSGGGFVGGWWSAWLARAPRFEVADICDPIGLIDLLRKNDYTKATGGNTDHFARYLMWAFDHPREIADAGKAAGEVAKAIVDAKTAEAAKAGAIATAAAAKAAADKSAANAAKSTDAAKVAKADHDANVEAHRQALNASEAVDKAHAVLAEKAKEALAAAKVGPPAAGGTPLDDSSRKPVSLAVLIRNYSTPDKPVRDELLRRLVGELNGLLGLYGLYQPRDDRFLNVPRSPTTENLLSQGDDADMKVLNHRLIEDALSQYLHRRQTFPPSERIEPERQSSYLYIRQQEQDTHNLLPGQDGAGEVPRETLELRDTIADGSLSAGSDPVHHLRLFANYLTPRKGALSADTWRAVSVVSRNLFLTWLILIPIFLAVVLLGQLYFLIHPSSARDFLHAGTATAPIVAPAPV